MVAVKRIFDDELRAAVRAPGADIPAIVGNLKLKPVYAVMIQRLLEDSLTHIAIREETGLSLHTIRNWARRLQVTQADRRSVAIYELSKGNLDLADVAQKAGMHERTVHEVIAATGTQWQFRAGPKTQAIVAAIDANPRFGNKQIAAQLGEGHDHFSVGAVRRAKGNKPERLPADITIEELYWDAATELVKRQLAKNDGPKPAQDALNTGDSGWVSRLDAKKPWPPVSQSRSVHFVAEGFLGTALGHYLKEAGIERPDQLVPRTEKEFVQLEKLPLPVFQALHFVLAARDVEIDRFKIQHGPRQTWLPSRTQMVITAKQVLGLDR